MGGKGDFLENALVGLALGATAFTPVGTVYIRLWTATPTDANGTGTEVSGGSYAALAIGNTTTNWNTASGGAVSNKVDFNFVTPTADWGTVTHYSIESLATGGNRYYWDALTASKIVQNGDPVSFPAGSLVVNED